MRPALFRAPPWFIVVDLIYYHSSSSIRMSVFKSTPVRSCKFPASTLELVQSQISLDWSRIVLIEKEVIRDGTYWYVDEETKLPKKLVVTPELRKYWYDQGSAMLSAGLPIPVPYEHDFAQHPMTPKDKLLNNAGEVKQYKLVDDKLMSVVDVQDPDVKKKIGHSIRWTSPWISSFVDGAGKQWNNVISHLALTTRPRVTKQEPFSSIASALSIATPTEVKVEASSTLLGTGASGFCLSRAGSLLEDPNTKLVRPIYPMAFSLWGGGIKLSEEDLPRKKGKDKKKSDKKPPIEKKGSEEKPNKEVVAGAEEDDEDVDEFDSNPLVDSSGDVMMEELLCDLLRALGVPMPEDSSETEFKRHLYEAAMCKITELVSKGDPNSPQNTAKQKIPAPNNQSRNPLINQVQQEQQPMYMGLGGTGTMEFSLEEINKLPDPMRGLALSMYTENQKLRTEMEASKKVTDSLRDAKLKEAGTARTSRVAVLSKLSPRVKADLDAMLALPSMALSMGDGGVVVDPMEPILAVLEKGFGDMPRLLTADAKSLSITPHPMDQDEMTNERANEIADGLARSMGCAPAAKAS